MKCQFRTFSWVVGLNAKIEDRVFSNATKGKGATNKRETIFLFQRV